MRPFSPDDLRHLTLARQFPTATGTGPDAVLEVLGRLGPIQSQVPRSPFLAASSRLPGTTWAQVRDLFAEALLLKTTNLRGTVHTCVREQFGWLDAVARQTRAGTLRSRLLLSRVTPADVAAEVEAFAEDDWQTRTEIVAHLRQWLGRHESAASAAAVTGSLPESLLWGHSGLLRRPRDEHWEKRTDLYHRRARAVVPDLGSPGFPGSLAALVRVHLGALGPSSRRDLAYFHGTGLTQVDLAVTALGEEVLRRAGPGGEEYLDLAEPPPDQAVDPGVRLLGEFDALLVGFHQSHRTRFVDADGLAAVWAKVNGQFAPVVLHGDRVVATWRTVTTGARTIVEVTPLPGHRAPPEDLLGAAAAATGTVLDLQLDDVRVLR